MSAISESKKTFKYLQKISEKATIGHPLTCRCLGCVVWMESTVAIEEINQSQAKEKKNKKKAEES